MCDSIVTIQVTPIHSPPYFQNEIWVFNVLTSSCLSNYPANKVKTCHRKKLYPKTSKNMFQQHSTQGKLNLLLDNVSSEGVNVGRVSADAPCSKRDQNI